MSLLWKKYLYLLNTHPWKTQIATAGILGSLGDILAQVAVEKKKSDTFEIKRVFRFATFGFVFAGPMIRGWYLILERNIRPSKLAGLQKMLLDQTIFAPFLLSTFLVVMGVLQRKSWDEINTLYRRDFPSVLKANYILWPWVQLVNFYLVPFQHRVFVVSFVALGWNTYLAWISNRNLDNIDKPSIDK